MRIIQLLFILKTPVTYCLVLTKLGASEACSSESTFSYFLMHCYEKELTLIFSFRLANTCDAHLSICSHSLWKVSSSQMTIPFKLEQDLYVVQGRASFICLLLHRK